PADVMDLDALAPDEPDDDDVMDLGALAPDEPADVMDLDALAPDEPADADVMDLDALAPDEPDDVMDLDALAPDEPDPMDLGALTPEESVEELAEAVTDEPLAEEEPEDDEPSRPIYTRTLADLYVKQGFPEKALGVLKALQKVTPDDEDLARRIEALEEGEPEKALSGKGGTSGEAEGSAGNGHSEDDVEMRARELAEHGQDGPDDVDVDTPFAWSASAEPPGSGGGGGDEPAAGNYFDQLLEWEKRSES
ncbi:MAG: hypothetical protein R3253_12900, partial [Longimicrobiales bacterium]|nr:hypothetical protein [Longimicrobiales bacterium]